MQNDWGDLLLSWRLLLQGRSRGEMRIGESHGNFHLLISRVLERRPASTQGWEDCRKTAPLISNTKEQT